MKFSELANEWLYMNHKDDIKPRTLLKYECNLKYHLLPNFKDEEIENLKPRDMQRWICVLKTNPGVRHERPLTASSINGIISMLKMIFNYAEDFEIITGNPMRRIKNLSKPKTTDNKVFTREEQIRIEHVIEALNDDEYFPIILTLYTGLRLGELCALTWSDINLKSGLIKVNKTTYCLPKNNGRWEYIVDSPKSLKSIREIPIPSFLFDKLRELKRNRKSLFIVCKNNGEKMRDKELVYKYTGILKKAKVRYLSFHALRHTFATRALEQNVDIKTLSEILGHSSISTTLNIYTHSLIKHKKQQIRKIKRLI